MAAAFWYQLIVLRGRGGEDEIADHLESEKKKNCASGTQ